MAATREKLSPFIATSAALHAMLFFGVVFAPLLFPKRTQTQWGTSTNKGVKVGVTSSLPGVPLPTPPVVQETAKGNQSMTLNPAEVAPKEQKKPSVKPAEVKVPSGKKPETKSPEPTRVARNEKAEPPPMPSNAIPGNATGQLPLPYGGTSTTSGPATFGDGSFGTRFPEYVNNMIRAIQLQWRNESLAGRGTMPRVYVKFTIGKRGDVSNVEIDQLSGVAQLDSSAKNAVMRASLPPLPPGYSGSTLDVRFYFEYTR